jgi:hypothetical protein
VIPRRHRSNGLAAAVVEGSGPRPGTFVLAVVAVVGSLLSLLLTLLVHGECV